MASRPPPPACGREGARGVDARHRAGDRAKAIEKAIESSDLHHFLERRRSIRLPPGLTEERRKELQDCNKAPRRPGLPSARASRRDLTMRRRAEAFRRRRQREKKSIQKVTDEFVVADGRSFSEKTAEAAERSAQRTWRSQAFAEAPDDICLSDVDLIVYRATFP